MKFCNIFLVLSFCCFSQSHGQIFNPQGCRVDICFVMDESGSIKTTNWQISVNFVADFVQRLSISPTATRVGIVEFNSFASLSITLDQYSDVGSLSNAIRSLPYASGGTAIDQGLRVARESCFSSLTGDRVDAPDILVLMTDGQSSQAPAIEEGRLAREAGINIISLGITSGINEALLINIADDADNYFRFDNFDLLLQDVSLILGRSCLVADDCAGGQLTLLNQNGTYPMISDCPQLSNPILRDNFYIDFMCEIVYNETDPDARYKVTFLFDSVDIGSTPTTLTPPNTAVILSNTGLQGNLNKYISCQVESYFISTPSVISPAIFSRSYWAGVAPSKKVIYLSEGDDMPQDLYFFSTLPIPGPINTNRPGQLRLDLQTTTDEITVYQPTDTDFTEVDICAYRFYQSDWKSNESLVYDVATPLQVLARRDPFSGSPRTVTMKLTANPTNQGSPFDTLESEDVTLIITDTPKYSCRARGDPYVTTFNGKWYAAMQQGYFVYVKSSSVRTFEIQARHFPCRANGSPSCSMVCAVAVREGDYVMGVDRCNEDGGIHVLTFNDLGLTEPNSTNGIVVKHNPSFSQYMIQTVGGARIVIDKQFRGVQIHISLPSRDFQKTKGLCGTYDDDSTNEFERPDGIFTTDLNDFAESWRIDESESFFAGYIPDIHTGSNTELDFCHCGENTTDLVSRPVEEQDLKCGLPALENPIADIINPQQFVRAQIPLFIWRNILKKRRRRRQVDNTDTALTDDIDDSYQLGTYNDTAAGTIPPWGSGNITQEQATEACQNAIEESPAYAVCNQTVVGDELETIMMGCLGDIQILQNYQLLSVAVTDYQKACFSMQFQQNVTDRGSAEFKSVINMVQSVATTVCPDNCNGQGTCVGGTCNCNAGLTGPACSVAVGSVPSILSLQGPDLCDVQERLCLSVSVTANDILNTPDLTCRVVITLPDGTQQTSDAQGTQTAANTVECPLPNLADFIVGGTTKASSWYSYTVALSNDGTDFSPASTSTRRVYDSLCVQCGTSAACTQKDDTCIIDGRCYADSSVLDSCYVCDATSSETEWSLLPGDGPTLDSDIPTIIKTEEDDITIQLQATDPAGNGVTFSLITSLDKLSLQPDGTLRWASGTTAQGIEDVTVRLTSTGCPRFNDVILRLFSTTCSGVCGGSSACQPAPGSIPGSGDYECTCDADPCVGTPCKNGGQCSNSNCKFECECTAAYSGNTCEDELPVTGTWGPWGEYSECSKPCDYGIQTRTRMCLRDPCSDDTTENQLCNAFNCREDNDEQDKGAVLVVENTNIQTVAENQDEARSVVADALNEYCKDNAARCCTGVNLRTLEEPGEGDMIFMEGDVSVASGYPHRGSSRDTLLKILVQVDILNMAHLCELPGGNDTEEDDPVVARRRRRAVSEIRTVSTTLLERALDSEAHLFNPVFGQPVRVQKTDDSFQSTLVIPLSATGAVIGSILLGILLVVIGRKCQKAWKERQERLEEDEKQQHCGTIDSHLNYGGRYPPYHDLHNSTMSSSRSNSSDPYDMRRPYRWDTRSYDKNGAAYPDEDPYYTRWYMPWTYFPSRERRQKREHRRRDRK